MTYVVSRPGARWEIRESVRTPKGPRGHTLASFRELTDDVIQRAVAAAHGPLDADRLRDQCLAARVPVGEPAVDAAARALLAEMTGNRLPSGPLRRQLADALAPRHPGGAGDWTQAPASARGETLADLLDLTDYLPPRPPTALRYPPLRSAARP